MHEKRIRRNETEKKKSRVNLKKPRSKIDKCFKNKQQRRLNNHCIFQHLKKENW